MKEKLQVIIYDWYRAGFDGAFPSGEGKGTFHNIAQLQNIGKTDFMFDIDFGTSDIELALESLGELIEEYDFIAQTTYDSVHDTILIKKM